jgi:cation-transporting ATPase 13A3/4/5
MLVTHTGTLTVQGLELQSVVPVSNGRFEPATTDMQHLPPSIPRLLASCHGLAWLGDMLVGDPLDQKLFAATGWALLDQPAAAAAAKAPPSLQQPPQPLQQQPGEELAVVHPPGRTQQQLRIVRRFEFTSQLMRNLVVVQLNNKPNASTGSAGLANGSSSAVAAAAAAVRQQQGTAAAEGAGASPHPLLAAADGPDLLGAPLAAAGNPSRASSPGSSSYPAEATHMLFLKGSPEVIKELVQPSSLPPDFDAVLAEYTREGLRVLALAQGAVLPGMLPAGAVQRFTQQQLEAAVPLQLVGLAVLANPLRPDSAAAIQDLQHALVSGCGGVVKCSAVL